MNLQIDIMRRFKRLETDERGVAFYYTVIIAFFILAVFTMIFDVSKVSEKKMQLQNAADSAALEMAVWQARGLNLVQNLNNEIYDTDNVLAILYGIAGGMSLVGEALVDTVILAEIGEAIEAAAAAIARIASNVHRFIVRYFLVNVRKVYANGTMLMGYVAANQVAKLNGAEPIIPSIHFNHSGGKLIDIVLNFIVKGMNKMSDKFVAVGIPTSPGTAVKLPLTTDIPEGMNNNLPLKVKEPCGNAAYDILIAGLMANPDCEGIEYWAETVYRSDPFDTLKLPPMIWIVYAKNDIGFISRYFLGGDSDEYHNIPIIAYALGQVQGGNVTKRSSYNNDFRPKYYGTGADAFLVPMSSVDLSTSKSKDGITIKLTVQDYVDKFFLH